MTVDIVREYCLSKIGSSEDFPFDQDTLVFKVLGKMFALVPLENWERGKASINLKCDPERAIQLREEHEEIIPGWHMNKKHWNTVDFEGMLSERALIELINHSYDLVVKGLSKKLKSELEQI